MILSCHYSVWLLEDIAAAAGIVYTNKLTPRIAQSVYELDFQNHRQRAFP
jgi:hypothetical protein